MNIKIETMRARLSFFSGFLRNSLPVSLPVNLKKPQTTKPDEIFRFSDEIIKLNYYMTDIMIVKYVVLSFWILTIYISGKNSIFMNLKFFVQ
jgi:hypothetical protein